MKASNETSRRVVAYLEALRARRGWSKAELTAKIAGTGLPWSPHRVHNLASRTETAAISLDEGVAIATALDMSLDELISMATGPCIKCGDAPPSGFTCNACGAVS